MPFLAPIIAFLASGTIGAFFANLAIGLGVSLAIGQVSKLFLKRNASATISQENAGRSITVRQSISPRRVIYGTGRYGGVITYLDTSSIGYQTNDFMHVVITMAGHEINAFTAMYFDGVLVPVDGSGEAVGDFSGLARVKFNYGTRDQTAFPDLVAETGGRWTSDHRQRGCACAYVRLKFDTTKYPGGMPNITFTVEGRKVYDPRTGTIAFSDNAALCIADYINNAQFTQGLRYESQSQNALFENDKGFDFVPTIQEVNLRWGPQQIPQA